MKTSCIHELLRCCANTRCSCRSSHAAFRASLPFPLNQHFIFKLTSFSNSPFNEQKADQANVNWLTRPIKCAHYKSKFNLKARRFPPSPIEQGGSFLVFALTAGRAGRAPCFPPLSITSDPRDSFHADVTCLLVSVCVPEAPWAKYTGCVHRCGRWRVSDE